jgi:hypothetical protein
MSAIVSVEFITDLDEAVGTGAPARRDQILCRVTDLLLANAERLNASQTGIFDGVFARLLSVAQRTTRFGSAADITKLMRPHVTNNSLATARTA